MARHDPNVGAAKLSPLCPGCGRERGEKHDHDLCRTLAKLAAAMTNLNRVSIFARVLEARRLDIAVGVLEAKLRERGLTE